MSVEKILIDLPDLSQCKNVENFSRILTKYLEDIQLIQKFLIRIRIPDDEQEAEKIYERYI